ncbi:hypothetical protein G3570_10705 [Balneolaceae bacterium YR4-1]|uniref:Lipoprotein n=1 Tax=Halalkalibaculum roseum TaxID=2709311 RepID=A0A6M1T536_9BACT|nr:hypothetical protein [Halalkalibaculum roseum]NGP77105.1 hypothetical protein [Halalkalibaculum roseum]
MKTLAFIILYTFLLTGCSLVGLGTGTAIDSANRKKVDRILSNNQKITLEFVDGKNIKARYRGIAYRMENSRNDTFMTNSVETTSKEQQLPVIGDEVTIFFDSDASGNIKGTFSGIQKSNDSYQFMIQENEFNQIKYLSLDAVKKIGLKNGKIMTEIPESENLILLYEKDGNIYRAPLGILNHINNQKTNNKFVLGTFGLAVDAALLIISYSNFSYDIGGW